MIPRRSSSPGKRLLGTAYVLLHVLVLVLAPILDARLEAAAAGGQPHAEAQTRAACAPVHSHDDCQLCRVLRSSPRAAEHPPQPPRLALIRARSYVERATAASACVKGPLGPRAPPAF